MGEIWPRTAQRRAGSSFAPTDLKFLTQNTWVIYRAKKNEFLISRQLFTFRLVYFSPKIAVFMRNTEKMLLYVTSTSSFVRETRPNVKINIDFRENVPISDIHFFLDDRSPKCPRLQISAP